MVLLRHSTPKLLCFALPFDSYFLLSWFFFVFRTFIMTSLRIIVYLNPEYAEIGVILSAVEAILPLCCCCC